MRRSEKRSNFISLLKLKYPHIDFSKSVHTHSREKISAICLIHGDISRRADSFMRYGCPSCGRDKGNKNQRISKDEIIKRFNNIHGFNLEYDMSNYENTSSRINIKCKYHGWFNQEVDVHLRGRSCRQCGQIGFKRSQAINKAQKKNNGYGILYLIKCFNDDEVFYKVGITTDSLSRRFCKGFMPYKYRVMSELTMSFDFAYNIEKIIHRISWSNRYTPKIKFGGSARECFTKVYFMGKTYE